jgi:hypothetical protein
LKINRRSILSRDEYNTGRITRLNIALQLEGILGSQIESVITLEAVQYSTEASAHSTIYVDINDVWYKREIEIINIAKG